MVSYLAPKTLVREETSARRVWSQTTACRGTLLTLCVAFGILYVVQISAVSTKGYDIAGLGREIQSLEEENQRLAVEIAKHSSMANVESRVAALRLVAVDQVEYIQAPEVTVARR